ncbi:MAG: PLP-dependent aspartate aminotransferase family protein [Planctomycetota bacterium]|jgi:cystathionine beta-lyase/cystathionine gamma-synthase|nr:PLP-dependent aspartate aminotransferase family protein [Planctomycetota bacterium]
MRRETLVVRAGLHSDPVTGAVSAPIHQSATFVHTRLPPPGDNSGYAYSRTSNPTRTALEKSLAALDGGARACAFSSGLAALDAVLRLLGPLAGKRLIVTEDPYGGTVRLLDKFFRPIGLDTVYIDTSDTGAVERELERGALALLLEIPSNPLLRVADVDALAAAAKRAGALLIVDNTFLTPHLFRPLEHGADLVVYSATKYLGGHNDLVAGAAVCRTEEMGTRLALVQNAVGAVLGPMDSWLLLRGLKTLAVRLDRQQENARGVAEFLRRCPRVSRVRYPGLPGDPGHERLRRQASGFGAMVSFEVEDPERVEAILTGTKIFSFAESLGGVESLITFPVRQTHADIEPAERERLGITDRLLRLSVGIENLEDLLEDLEQALA